MNCFDWRGATPEQRRLWKYASTLIAYNTITPLVYIGVSAGSEFLTYNAGKLYIGLEVEGSAINGQSPTAQENRLDFYNEANVKSWIFQNNGMVLDSTDTPGWQTNPCITRNIYFSRIVATGYTYFKFIGYRLNV